MFAQIGTHILSGLKTPGSYAETHAAKIGRVPRINTKDAVQKTGDELTEINLSIQYVSAFCVPADEIASLKKTMHSGEILPFITGEGDIIGNFILTGIDVTNESYTLAGTLESATASIKLLEHPSVSEEKAPAGEALKSAKPPVQTPPPVIQPSPAGQINTDIAEAKNNVNKMKTTVSKVKKGVITTKKGVRDVKKLATTTQQLYTNAKTKIEVTKKIIKRADELPTSLDSAIKYAENLTNLSNVADSTVLEMNVKKMADSAEKINTHAAPVVSFAATREGGM